MIDWMQFAKVEKKGGRWTVEFEFTESIDECERFPFEIFVDYAKTKREGIELARKWLIEQARSILTALEKEDDW